MRLRIGCGLGIDNSPDKDKLMIDPRHCGSYLEVLADPKTGRVVATVAFFHLPKMPYVHPDLLTVAAKWATHDHKYVRSGVLDFIGAHGSERQLPLAAAMLFDHEPYVGYAAADALQRIGTVETQRVFDVWLAKTPRSGEEHLRAHVLKRAEELRTRLAK